jgi:type 2 lantibiotic biosynthesis protein LanM
MNEPLRNESCWYRAFTLAERARTLPQDNRRSRECAAAARRFHEWRSQRPFCGGPLFEERLALDGLTGDGLVQLVTESPGALRLRTVPPEWLIKMEDSFRQERRPAAAAVQDPPSDYAILEILRPFDPLIANARERLRNGIRRLCASGGVTPFAPASVESLLLNGVPSLLVGIVSRTIALELNVARLMDQLHGATPRLRFHSFIETLSCGGAILDLLREYPVLARLVTDRLSQWVEFNLEFLHHLCADWPGLCAQFGGHHNLGVLEALDGSAGDTHRQGRSVRIARFSSGLRLVYKPKSLAVEKHFQELLAWINAHDPGPDGGWFRTLTVMDRGTHGWVEFAAAAGCDSRQQVERFYQRQGACLAVLYALEAVDFHFENLIAAGEYPVLIDLEALFHPRIGDSHDGSANARASALLSRSVMRVGLLPQRVMASEDSGGWDIGGLSSAEGQLTPFEVSVWDDAATDVMRFSRKRVPLRESLNQPKLPGRSVDLLDHADSIVEGFTRIYRLIRNHREELLQAGGPVARFADDEVRALVRPTAAYGVLLDDSFHPDVLRDGLDRDRLFDRLWLAVEHMPYLRRIVHAEREDLVRGDIPLFTTRPDSNHLWTSTGERIEGFFEEPGLSLVRRRIGEFDEDDLARQIWFIRASLSTGSRSNSRAARASHGPHEPGPVTRERLLAAARAAGGRLESLALRGAGDVTWIGLTYSGDASSRLTPLGLDLYDGLPGVTLFLAHLAALTGEERFRALAEGALISLRAKVAASKPSLKAIGGFVGWGGIIYSLTHLAVALDRPELLDDAGALVTLLPPLIEKDTMLDFIGGAAGCICALLALNSYAPSRRTLDAAMLCGERLLASAQPAGRGLGWMSKAATRPLTGLSHGAAGFTMALLALASATGGERFRRAALASLDFENGEFAPDLQNWLDYRDVTGGGKPLEQVQTGQTSWCHGAMGVGLSRLFAMRHLDRGTLRSDVEIAMATTLDHGFGMNHSLCHGDSGNLELFLQASRLPGEHGAEWQLSRLAAILLQDIAQNGWICGHPLKVESPGLMTGLAGIGYQLLRIAEPERVPAVLLLDPPAAAPPMAALPDRATIAAGAQERS